MGLRQAAGQVTLEAMVSRGPLVAGHSFRVQFLMEEQTQGDEFFPPDFGRLKMVSGPDVKPGTQVTEGGTRRLRNISYTLKAIRPGLYILPAAQARINGQLYRSQPVQIQVFDAAEAQRREKQASQDSFSEIYLAPGENPAARIAQNLFIRVVVDRKNCFVGQPVQATFKLYSRLQSRSDIVKNPGFYGFAVQDVVGLKSQQVSKENLNGKEYDVHIVRKVQLYPLQEGRYTIDPMEVVNKVSFWKAGTHPRLKQEVVEGVFEDKEESADKNVITVESTMHTEPVSIVVRALPEQGQPDQFGGAVGKFTVSSRINNLQLARNEQGLLELIVRGQGNLTQITAPKIEWPSGMEGFDPQAVDSLQFNVSPMQGTRTFRYRFVSSSGGEYHLPDVLFSFFDPDSNRYRTVQTHPGKIQVSDQEKQVFIAAQENITGKKYNPATIYLTVIVALVIAGVIFTWRRESRRSKKAAIPPPPPRVYITADKALQPLSFMQEAAERDFLQALRTAIWTFFQDRVVMTGTAQSKPVLARLLDAKGIPPATSHALLEVLETCETGMYAFAETGIDKAALLQQTQQLLKEVEPCF